MGERRERVGFLYPVAQRLIQRCDAMLRVPGEFKGADGDLALAYSRGIPVFNGLRELIDGVTSGSPAEDPSGVG